MNIQRSSLCIYKLWLDQFTSASTEVVKLVRPDMLRHALFGPPGSSDLSTERREQLAIAVEPVANPSFIFMDEPTSGLDGQAAAIVMRTALTLLTLEEFVLFTSRVLTYLKHLMSCLCIIYGGKPGTNSRIPIDYFQVKISVLL